MGRAEFQRTASPHLIADVTMYATENGGRAGPAYPGWGCPCMVSQAEPLTGWDALPLLRDDALAPGQQRRLGFCFLSGEAAATIMRDAGRFYLWEGKFIGEAVVVE
jgi:hypothetical protein